MDEYGRQRKFGTRGKGTDTAPIRRNTPLRRSNVIGHTTTPSIDLHLEDCYGFQDLAMSCGGSSFSQGSCSFLNSACCQCVPTGYGNYLFNSSMIDSGVLPTPVWASDEEYWGQGESNVSGLISGDGNTDFESALFENINNAGGMMSNPSWDMQWQNQCVCMFTCNESMFAACGGSRMRGAGYGGGSGYSPRSGATGRYRRGERVRRRR